jgi:hypothetical protein
VKKNVWVKSTRTGSNGQCVEVNDTGDAVLIRDSKDPTGPALRFTQDEWRAFVAGVCADEFEV